MNEIRGLWHKYDRRATHASHPLTYPYDPDLNQLISPSLSVPLSVSPYHTCTTGKW